MDKNELELIYTGISRARESIEIWGEEKVFLKAVNRKTERSSGLKEALQSTLPGGAEK